MATATKAGLIPNTALRDAREAAEMSQHELAAASGCTVATISDLENGRNRQPSHTKVVRIITALRNNGLANVMADDLFPVEKVPIVYRKNTVPKRKRRWISRPRS
jgi:transcriptional regulator with XRE-family HTH domain